MNEKDLADKVIAEVLSDLQNHQDWDETYGRLFLELHQNAALHLVDQVYDKLTETNRSGVQKA